MSCLFNSLSYFIIDINADKLRKIICDYIEHNPFLYDDIDVKMAANNNIDKYVNKMRKTSTWGGAIEIKAFCDIYNIIVKVKTNDNKLINFIPKQSKNPIKGFIIVSWNGGHYKPIKIP